MDNEERKYIDAEEAILEIRKWYFNTDIQKAKDDPCVIDAMIDLFIRTIRAQKPADVRSVKRGQWIISTIPQEQYVCSQCGGACWYYDYMRELGKSKYCPSCGAYMR